MYVLNSILSNKFEKVFFFFNLKKSEKRASVKIMLSVRNSVLVSQNSKGLDVHILEMGE